MLSCVISVLVFFAGSCGPDAVEEINEQAMMDTLPAATGLEQEPPADPLIRAAYDKMVGIDSNFLDFYWEAIVGDLTNDGREEIIIEYGIGFEGAARSMMTGAWLFVNSEEGLVDSIPFPEGCFDITKIQSQVVFLTDFINCALSPEVVSYDRYKYYNGNLILLQSFDPDPENPDAFLFNEDAHCGLILPRPDSAVDASSYIKIPATGFTLYNSDFEKAGHISRETEFDYCYGLGDENRDIFDSLTICEYWAEELALEFVNSRDGFVEIFGSYWLNIDEINESGYELWAWDDIVLQYMASTFYVKENGDGIYLRERPDKESRKTFHVKDHTFHIHLTGKTEGNWIEVNVTEYVEDPWNTSFDRENIKNEGQGWIELLDENGFPSVVYFPRD